MRRFVEEADRGQWTLLPECLDDFIDEENPVRVIDVFVDALPDCQGRHPQGRFDTTETHNRHADFFDAVLVPRRMEHPVARFEIRGTKAPASL
jgi:hypothetical protein